MCNISVMMLIVEVEEDELLLSATAPLPPLGEGRLANRLVVASTSNADSAAGKERALLGTGFVGDSAPNTLWKVRAVIAINACLVTFIFDNTGDDNTIVELDRSLLVLCPRVLEHAEKMYCVEHRHGTTAKETTQKVRANSPRYKVLFS